MSHEVWELTGHWINSLQHEIDVLDAEGILGHALVRACHEWADAISHWTTQLQTYQQQHQQSSENDDDDDDVDDNVIPNTHRNKNDLLDHSVNSLLLQIDEVTILNQNKKDRNAVYDIPDVHNNNAITDSILCDDIDDYDYDFDHHLVTMTQIDPVPPVLDLLHDMEQALRSVDEEDANDLADAAITVGHLLVAALQQVHSQFVPPPVATSDPRYSTTQRSYRTRRLEESPNITRLDDDDNETTDDTDTHNSSTVKPSSSSSTGTMVPPYQPYKPKRARCLWPPLQPVAQNIFQYTQTEVLPKQPIYITAPILLTCWPLLVTSTIIGSGMVVTDNVLQHVYDQIQDHPIIVTSEVTMASFLQTIKLGYLTTKAVAKPTLRVVKKQIQRHAPHVQESVVYHIQHPLETIHATMTTALWCGQQVVQYVGQALHEWQQQQASSTSNSHDDALSVNVPMVDSDATNKMLQHMSL